ncbi:MAG: tetratricopeptide repeat protein [Desulfosarcinaceae bacterium]|nr:tetratricopeptide repeat protein [Desulfosarcinaceae bacterium]
MAANAKTPQAKTAKPQGYVKTENLLLSILIALAVGFVGGVVFGIYRSPTITPPPSSGGMPPQGQPQASGPAPLTPEKRAEIEGLKAMTAKTPDNADAWIQLGHLYFDTGQHGEAIASYQKALAITPDNANVLTDLGVMYRRSKQPDKAIESFDKAIQVDARHEIARFNKGVVLLHDLNDTDGALNAWRELVALNPNATAPGGQLVKELIERFAQKATQE